jgi:hypothetical protein
LPRNMTEIRQSPNADVIKVGAETSVVVQSSEYNGRAYVSVLRKGPMTNGFLQSRAQLDREQFLAVVRQAKVAFPDLFPEEPKRAPSLAEAVEEATAEVVAPAPTRGRRRTAK